MRLTHPLKLGTLAVIASLGFAGGGCLIVDDDRGGGRHHDDDGQWNNQPPGETPISEPEQVVIDADAVLQTDVGEGIGVMVEYATGGHWRVYTTCDYNTPANPGVACNFDLFVKPLEAGITVGNTKGEDLSGKDTIEISADGSVHLFTQNTLGRNGMTFDTAPGAMIELEVYIDGQQDPHFIYWVGKEVLHRGAPTDPVHFVPSEPAPTVDPPKDDGSNSNPAP